MIPLITWLDVCGSTNAVLSDMPDAEAATVIAARSQTAGRGQRGASWEAQPGANLTFSQLFRPASMHAARQFELSMLISLAVADTIDSVLELANCDKQAKIKWPNDIYIDDYKISGILIENKTLGRLHRPLDSRYRAQCQPEGVSFRCPKSDILDKYNWHGDCFRTIA